MSATNVTMLTTLRIKNLALVADLTLELQPGYNVITGETGAGKSILIGGLNLLLGGRADRTLIRGGSDACAVEAAFDVGGLKAPLKRFLEENGLDPCEDDQLVLKRSLAASGANRQFVNRSPASLNTLAAIGEWLVDIHGPHDHQSLLRPGHQLALLDAFGGLGPEREAFGALARRLQALETDKTALVTDEKAYAEQLDLLRFQVGEIAAAGLRADEDREVEENYRRAGNAAKLLDLGRAALDLAGESEDSVLARAGLLGRALHELQRVDSGVEPLLQIHEQAVDMLRELQTQISRYVDKVELDPEHLRQLEERLNLIQSLKHKYGAQLADVIAFGEQARSRLDRLEQRDADVARLNSELQKTGAELQRAGQALSAQRHKVIPLLSRAVSRQLSDLGFKQSRFEVALGRREFQISNFKSQIPLSGFDSVEFQFAPNPGEPSRPLRAIASSGELARVMLALKTVLAAEDDIPVLIFDEVDANVGGETAHAVGEKMRRIAERRQVLCITHLPQVAAPASAHFVVTKTVRGGRTLSEITRLDKRGRVEELTRMLGGQGGAARRHAEALLGSVPV